MKFKYLSKEQVKEIKELARAKKPSDLKHFVRMKVETFATPEEVREARKKLHMSQRDFAGLLGLSERAVQSWEQDWRIPDALATKIIRLLTHRPSFADELKAA